jgi:tetratricopeptide (TPR) repeat protein
MKGHKDKGAVVATGSGIVVGGGKSYKHIWRFAGLVLVVAVLSTAAGVGVRVLQQHKNAPKVDPAQASADKAQSLAIDGDYSKATQEIQQALKNPNLKPEQKYTLEFQQGVTYENQQNYSSAIAAYKRADAIDPTRSTAAAIARAAAAAGDKTTAIAYYQKAIARIPADYPLKTDTKTMYQDQIKALEGQ